MKKIVLLTTALVFVVLGAFVLTLDDVDNTETVNLYYYNPALDTDETGNILCSAEALVPVEREVEDSEDIIGRTVEMLIRGKLREEEVEAGIETEFPLDEFELADYSLNNDGVLTLAFDDPLFRSSGGSCRVGLLAGQIRKTAEQFSEVEEVRILPEDILQP